MSHFNIGRLLCEGDDAAGAAVTWRASRFHLDRRRSRDNVRSRHVERARQIAHSRDWMLDSARQDRLEALIIARAHSHSAPAGWPLGELLAPLARFAPAELTAAAWREHLAAVVAALQAQGVLDAEHR